MRILIAMTALVLAGCTVFDEDKSPTSTASVQVIDLPARMSANEILLLPFEYQSESLALPQPGHFVYTFSERDRDTLLASVVGTLEKNGLRITQSTGAATREAPTVAVQITRYGMTSKGCVLEGTVVITKRDGSTTRKPIAVLENSPMFVKAAKNEAIRSFVAQLAAILVESGA